MDTAIRVFQRRLQKLPDCKADEFYRLADYIELKAIADLDGFYSKGDYILDAKKRSEDLGEGDIEEVTEIIKSSDNAKRNDKWESKADDIFRVLEARTRVFAQYYPFTITENNAGIQFVTNPTTEQLYYIFLLYSANLRYTLKFKKELTSSFEKASEEALRSILPYNAEIKLFGSSNTEDGKVDDEWISDKLFDKLTWLSKFLNCTLRIRKEEINKYDKGDRGLDLIAKIHFNDNQSNLMIFFAQCACSPNEWTSKQAATSTDRWDSLIELNTVPNRLMFIPQSYRNSDGNWYDKYSIHKNVVIDRQRLLENFKNENLFKSLTAYPVLKQLVAVKESNF